MRFVARGNLAEDMGEDPFRSRRGFIEPGRDSDDAVIGRSGITPVVDHQTGVFAP